ncbi:MAG: Flagellar hook protein FlgE [Firmicutes bacterium]|nr:Flagellar hook protein FlgE [candidate division NPL-UPA2 bacterium]
MLRSLFSAISGMRSKQTKLDVIANNISNVNTTGFKGSRVKFHDMLSQTLRNASAPVGGRAGTNPAQVGLGVAVGGIDTSHVQGALQATGRISDLAIQGSGFFVMADGNRTLFTRDGAFSLSLARELVNPATGFRVQGWMADAAGNISTATPPTAMQIPLGESVITQPTTRVEFSGNLTNSAPPVPPHVNTVTVFDSKGEAHQLNVTFTRSAMNTWSYAVTSTAIPPLSVTPPATTTLSFDTSGAVTPATATSGTFTVAVPGAANIAVTLQLGSMTQVAGGSTAVMRFQDGYAPGELLSYIIGRGGVITGTYSNGLVRDIGQITLAYFGNPEALLKEGGNLYAVSPNSGEPLVGVAGSGGRGSIEVGMLEMSNVDLATEFTEMISTNRAFQANARTVSTSDEMLQELIQLKR